MAASGLPPDWVVRHSTSRNLPYYFNEKTKESRWEPPEGSDSKVLEEYQNYHNPAAAALTATSQDGNLAGGNNHGKIRAAHLLVKHNESRRPQSWRETSITRSKAEAKEIIRGYQAQITSGEKSLGELASTESDCSSARKKGDLGTFGKGEMQKEFEEVAFALEPGQISDVVETASGLHLIERIS